MNLITGLGSEIGVRQAGSPRGCCRGRDDRGRDARARPRAAAAGVRVRRLRADRARARGRRRALGGGSVHVRRLDPARGCRGHHRVPRTLVLRAGSFETAMFAIEGAAGDELARICVNGRGPAIPLLPIFPPNLGGPATWVSAADGQRLAGLVGAPARLRSGGQLRPGLRDANVIAELPGAQLGGGRRVCALRLGLARTGRDRQRDGRRGRTAPDRALPRRTAAALAHLHRVRGREIRAARRDHYVRDAEVRGRLARIVGVVNLDCIAHGPCSRS